MSEIFSSGLTSVQAKALLVKIGPNHVSQRPSAWWQILARQFKSPFIYLLLGAAAVSGILSSPTDSLAILAFIVLNTGLGFYQEFASEKILQALEVYIKFSTRTLRDGQIKDIPNSNLVPGDVIELRPGNIVPADAKVLAASGFTLDESSLSGESAPVVKAAAATCFAGTSVSSGGATAEITATGKSSALGRIAQAAQSGQDSTFEKDIASFSRFVLKLVLLTLAALFIVNLTLKGPSANLVELLLFCIALAVSVIPEALPIVITFSLSRGAAHLAKNKVVVKKLLSIEDLGGIQVLATDKTGTLTENHLTVSESFPASSPDLLLWSAAASESMFVRQKVTDPFDLALLQSLSGPQKTSLSRFSLVSSTPFDPAHRTTSTLVATPAGRFYIIRGAPESLLPHCHLSSPRRSALTSWMKHQGTLGRRVLATAKRPVTSSGLQFIGLVSFVDPVKKTASQAVSTARKLGVSLKIITGDSPEVASTVAKEIGLITSASEVMTGNQFDALSQEDQVSALASHSVFARTSPFQKNTIVDLLQTQFSVGYLGDGINDAIALESADVGLAVSNASQVAREASDIVLLEKDLKVIVDGIHEGRIIASNTSKYITATMASNFGNFYAVAISSLFISFLPMLPLQILALNLLSDFPMISIATDTVDPDEVASPTRFQVHNFIDVAMVLGIVSTLFDFLFFALYFRVSEKALQTNWFIGSILTELVFIYSIRTKKLFFKSTWPSLPIIFLTAFAFGLTLLLPFTKFGLTVFSFSSPSLQYLSTDLLLVLAYFITTELVKLVYFRFRAKTRLL